MDLARRLRRRQRLFIVATVLLIVVGLPTLWFVMTYRSRQILRRIEALNGMARSTNLIGHHFPGGLLRYGETDWVHLQGPQTDDSELEVLQGVTGLQTLFLIETRVTDHGLAELSGLNNLTNLIIANIDQTKPLVTGKGLERLKDMPKLVYLELAGSPTTDKDLQGLKAMKNLRVIVLKATKVTPSGMAELKKALPNCTVFLR